MRSASLSLQFSKKKQRFSKTKQLFRVNARAQPWLLLIEGLVNDAVLQL